MSYNFEFSCKGCLTKHGGCHAECETYKQERLEYEKKKAEYDKYKEAQYYSNTAIVNMKDDEAKRRKSNRGYRHFRR